jgi:hypothetical protein
LKILAAVGIKASGLGAQSYQAAVPKCVRVDFADSLYSRYGRPVRLCSVSVDLDEIACYSQIHGLASETECHAVYDVALARIRDFAAGLALPLTLFVIARDLDRSQNVIGLRQMVSDGHEIGNHSQDHWYDLTRRERGEQTRQVVNANVRIKEELGIQPLGFRAPGYTVSDTLLEVVGDAGLLYDSSVFPCPPYYAAKAAALFRLRWQKRASRAVLDSPAVLRAPSTPYRVGVQYWTCGRGLLELPIQVAGPLRLPFIGTSLSLLGPGAARLVTRGLVGEPFVNLELHGIDFLESRDLPSVLATVQPDVRVPLSRKLQTFAAVLETLRRNGYTAVCLEEAARVFG